MYQNFVTSSMHVKAEQTNSLIHSSVICIWLALLFFLQNGRSRGSVGNALPKHLSDWCLIAEGGGWRCEQGCRFKIPLRREERSQFFFFFLRWTCTSQKWHNFFLRVEEIVIFLQSGYDQGRAFDLPQRCEKRCSHVPSPFTIKQVIGKNCTMLKWALVEKGTNFFRRVGQISIFLLSAKSGDTTWKSHTTQKKVMSLFEFS